MNLGVVGTGYVGLVSGACLADFGHTVVCVDHDVARIERLRRNEIPFFEPGLAEVVHRNTVAGRLRFTTELAEAVMVGQVIFLAVGTPSRSDGEVDLSHLAAAAAEVATHLDGYRVIAIKSTVPVGTGRWLREHIQRYLPTLSIEFDVVSNPEFLREGSAVSDFLRPDRMVVGTTSERAATIMREIYRPLYLVETPMVFAGLEAAELTKYASNAFLAVKISFMNEMANLCDRVGVDVHVVAKGMGLDKRIGPKFLHPGPGFGGSCFPKDCHALVRLGRHCGARQRIVEAAIEVNRRQRNLVFQKIARAVGGVRGKTIAILGLSFKPNTSDVREAPAVYLCQQLARQGAYLRAYDPAARVEAAAVLSAVASQMAFVGDAYEAAMGADALVIMTEWNEFRSLDLEALRVVMKRPILVDTRNVLDPTRACSLGFTYFATGREALAAPQVQPAGTP